MYLSLSASGQAFTASPVAIWFERAKMAPGKSVVTFLISVGRGENGMGGRRTRSAWHAASRVLAARISEGDGGFETRH